MHRARRLASIAVVTAAGLLALTGCRADPDVAAYVGTQRYTEDQVKEIYNDAYDKLLTAVRKQAAQQAEAGAQGGATASPSPQPKKVELPITRRNIVEALVGRDLLKAAAERLKITKVDIPGQELFQTMRLPLDSQFMQIWAEHQGYLVGLLQSLPKQTPAEADVREVYDKLVAGNSVEPGTSLTAFASQLGDDQRGLIASRAAARAVLAEQVRRSDVVVNPRYAQAELVLLNFQDAKQVTHPLISVPLKPDSGVRDAA